MRGYFAALISLFLFFTAGNGFSKYVTDEELYKKAFGLEKAVKEVGLRIEKLKIELTLMIDVSKRRTSRIPASQIPLSTRGKPVVDIDKFKENLKKITRRELRVKVRDHEDEIRERKKTLTRLKEDRKEIFRLIRYRVRGRM